MSVLDRLTPHARNQAPAEITGLLGRAARGIRPEGTGTGLKGPVHFRHELLEAEAKQARRKMETRLDSARGNLAWTKMGVDRAQARIDADEARVASDHNPIGRERRNAERGLRIAQARADLANWHDLHEGAIERLEVCEAEAEILFRRLDADAVRHAAEIAEYESGS